MERWDKLNMWGSSWMARPRQRWLEGRQQIKAPTPESPVIVDGRARQVVRPIYCGPDTRQTSPFELSVSHHVRCWCLRTLIECTSANGVTQIYPACWDVWGSLGSSTATTGYFVHCVQRGALLDKSTQVASRSLVFREKISCKVSSKVLNILEWGLGGRGSTWQHS